MFVESGSRHGLSPVEIDSDSLANTISITTEENSPTTISINPEGIFAHPHTNWPSPVGKRIISLYHDLSMLDSQNEVPLLPQKREEVINHAKAESGVLGIPFSPPLLESFFHQVHGALVKRAEMMEADDRAITSEVRENMVSLQVEEVIIFSPQKKAKVYDRVAA